MNRARWHARSFFLQMVDTSIDTLWCVVSLHISFQTCLAWWRRLGCMTVVVKPRLWQCCRLSWCNVDFYKKPLQKICRDQFKQFISNKSQIQISEPFPNHLQSSNRWGPPTATHLWDPPTSTGLAHPRAATVLRCGSTWASVAWLRFWNETSTVHTS